MSVDILGDVPFTDAYLRDNCRQCRKEDANGESVFDEEYCIDQIDYEPLPRDEPVYRTTDDGSCWRKDTYDDHIGPRGMNPMTRNRIRTPETSTDASLTENFLDACRSGRVDEVQTSAGGRESRSRGVQ